MPHKTSAINLKTVQENCAVHLNLKTLPHIIVSTKFLFLSWWKIYWHTTYLKKIKSCKKLRCKN